MTRRILAILFAAVLAACDRAPRRPSAPAAAEPRIPAVVLTIRTTLQPGNRTQQHTVVIAGDRARDTSERDVWRIVDAKNATVTWVDEVAETVRTEGIASIEAARRKRVAGRLASFYPHAKVTRGSEVRRIQGVEARELAIDVGGYHRSLWLGEVPGVPARLFAMMQQSRSASSPLDPMMHAADDALAEVRGFPLTDRAEVKAGNETFVVEHRVTSIGRRDVAQRLFELPRGFKDVTPRPARPQR